MRIGVFVVMAGRKAGGPETYELCLLRGLAKIDRSNEYHVFCLSDKSRASIGINQDNFFFHVLRPSFRWASIPVTLPLSLMKAGVDMFHATFIPPPVSPTKYAFTMHDLTMFHNPEFYNPLIRWRLNHSVRRGLKSARVVVCVSDCVRQVANETFGLPAGKLAVVHHGVNVAFRQIPAKEAAELLAQHYGIKRPYVVFVGKMQARKNIPRILEAFHRVRRDSQSDLALVLAGTRGSTADGIEEVIHRLQLAEHVVELGHVDQEHLPALYSGAQMLVFPSLYEGFGIPVLEAMACGTPVLTSNVSALPEVAGNCALLVDPYSVEAISQGMLELCANEGLRQSLRSRGLEHAKKFTWEQTARQTLSVYHRVWEN